MKKKTLFIACWHDYNDDKWELFVSEKGRELSDFKKYYQDEFDVKFDDEDSIDIFPIEKEMDSKGKEYKVIIK
jgi:hypothetical protein